MKSGISVMSFASRTTDSMLSDRTVRPWWNASAQKLQPPKQPRLCVIEKRTSSMAGTPPSFAYMGCQVRI